MSEPPKQRNLGEISFGILCPVEENSAGYKPHHPMGDERVRLLKLAVADKLPEGMILIAQRSGGGYERVTNEAFKEESIEYYKLREPV